MNDIIASTAILSFLAFPPVLLSIKLITKKPAWWVIFLLALVFILLVWGMIFSAYVGEQEHINELIDQKRYEELPEGWDSDGASGLFAVFGGWLVPLVYFIFWLPIYALAEMIRNIFKSGDPPNKSKHGTPEPGARV